MSVAVASDIASAGSAAISAAVAPTIFSIPVIIPIPPLKHACEITLPKLSTD